MSGGPEDANAMGRLHSELVDVAYKMRDAIKAAEEGHRGWAVDAQDAVNKILLPCGWKIVKATPTTIYT